MKSRRHVAGVTLAATAVIAAATGPVRAGTADITEAQSASPGAPARSASVFLVHALPETPVSVQVDGGEQQSGVDPGTIVGPLRLAPGAHTVTVTGADPAWTLDAKVTVRPGRSADVVLHRPANVANGEFATAEVPVGSHQVSIVPTGQRRPVLLGPIELAAEPATLTQVFAVGRPQSGSMDVIVQTHRLATRGSPAPEQVNTGSAGLVAGVPVVTH